MNISEKSYTRMKVEALEQELAVMRSVLDQHTEALIKMTKVIETLSKVVVDE